MVGQNCWKKTLPFALSFTIGLFAAGIVKHADSPKLNEIRSTHRTELARRNTSPEKEGRGTSGSFGQTQPKVLSMCIDEYNSVCNKTSESDGKKSSSKVTPLKILFKSKPEYTDLARKNNTEGKVTLRVTFSANGEIGSISAVKGLPNGLTESAVEAARNIKFEPAKKDGVPYTVTKQVRYDFSIY